jgi:ribosomal protein S8
VPPFERGEVGIVRTGEAVMSMGEAIMRNVGGEIIMRVSSE